MKRGFIFSLVLLVIFALAMAFSTQKTYEADGLSGAWKRQAGDEEQVLILMDGYLTHTSYDREGKRFIQTRGGSYRYDKNKLQVTYEFDTRDKEQVGKTISYDMTVKDGLITANINGKKENWSRIDAGDSGLAGLWQITARKQGEQLQPIHQTGTRKTIKILTATRFQWAAIDPGTKQFMGTGGGRYTFQDGKYTEHIEFFSRDSSRVGSSLSFDGRLENGDWHHSGLSSRGEPIYEVWSRKK